MASMSAEDIANAQAGSCRRPSLRQVFWKAVNDSAALLMGVGRGGGMSNVCALVGFDAHVVVHRGDTKSMVSLAQSMAGLWWRSQGMPSTRG